MSHEDCDCGDCLEIACRYLDWGTPDPWCQRHGGRQCDCCREDGNRECYPIARLYYVQYAEDPEAHLECADCIAESGDELQRCHDCLTYYHMDTEMMVASICIGCEERRLDEDAKEPIEKVYA